MAPVNRIGKTTGWKRWKPMPHVVDIPVWNLHVHLGSSVIGGSYDFPKILTCLSSSLT